MSNIEFWYHHVGVSVADMDGSIDWYDRVLGFKLERRNHVASIPAEIAILRNGDMHVELLKVPNPAPAAVERQTPDDDLQTCGNKHISFSCADVHSVVAVLRERGADIVWVKDQGNGRVNTFLRDFEGNLIEFLQYPKVEDPRAVL